MNFVTSLDGAVSVDGYSAGLSGEPDKRVFGLLRMLCDALVVAAGTLRHEGYRALRLDERRRAWRREHGLPEYPTLVVVSGSLDLDPAQAAFADAPVRPLVLTRTEAPHRPDLEKVADVVRLGTDRVDLAAGLAELRRRGLGQLLCEGGPQLFGALTAPTSSTNCASPSPRCWPARGRAASSPVSRARRGGSPCGTCSPRTTGRCCCATRATEAAAPAPPTTDGCRHPRHAWPTRGANAGRRGGANAGTHRAGGVTLRRGGHVPA